VPARRRPLILLLVPRLDGGGAQRVVALLAKHLSSRSYELHLGALLAPEAGTHPAEFPPQVTLHGFQARRVRAAAGPLLRLIRRLRPELILSSMAHLNFLVLLLRPFFPASTRVMVRQNATVSAALAFGGLPFYTRLLYRLLYPRADRVICQSQAMADDLANGLRIPAARLAILPNPIEVDALRAHGARTSNPAGESACWSGPGPHLLAIGRLAPEKGFDLLLHALTAVRERFPLAELALVGAGKEEAALRALAKALGLEGSVHFTGEVAQPAVFFPSTDLFVLSSRHEGLPNALLEAAAAGLPLVSTPASGGVVALLRDQPGCWLASGASAAELTVSLQAALGVLKPGQCFPHPFIEAFRLERAVGAYADLIDAVLREGR